MLGRAPTARSIQSRLTGCARLDNGSANLERASTAHAEGPGSPGRTAFRLITESSSTFTSCIVPRTPCLCCRRCLCGSRSEEHTSELQSLRHLVCRLLLEKT